MNCPNCQQPMAAEPLFFSVKHVCRYCSTGTAPRELIGHVVIDMGLITSLEKQPIRLMVFRDALAAVGTLNRMTTSAYLYDVLLEVEPKWVPRIKRPEDSVAWMEVRWDRDRQRLVGRTEGKG